MSQLEDLKARLERALSAIEEGCGRMEEVETNAQSAFEFENIRLKDIHQQSEARLDNVIAKLSTILENDQA